MNWIKCNEQMPEPDTWVLVWNEGECVIGRFDADWNYWAEPQNRIYGKVTHWQPLPEPPATV